MSPPRASAATRLSVCRPKKHYPVGLSVADEVAVDFGRDFGCEFVGISRNSVAVCSLGPR